MGRRTTGGSYDEEARRRGGVLREPSEPTRQGRRLQPSETGGLTQPRASTSARTSAFHADSKNQREQSTPHRRGDPGGGPRPDRHHAVPRQDRSRRDLGTGCARSGHRPRRDWALGGDRGGQPDHRRGDGPSVGTRPPRGGPRPAHGVVARADPRRDAAGRRLREGVDSGGRGHPGPSAARLRRARALQGGSGPGRNRRRPPAGGAGRAPGPGDSPRARGPAGSHRERGPGSPRGAVLGSNAVGSIEAPGRHSRPGARGPPRPGGGRRGGHDARVPPPRRAAAPGGHGRRRPVRPAARRLDRRHLDGAGPRQQPGGVGGARRPGPDGPLRPMVAARRLLAHRRVFRHRKHHPRCARPLPADRQSARRLDRWTERGQRLADAARPGRPPLLERPAAPGLHRRRPVPHDPRGRGGGGRLPGVRGAARRCHRGVAARRRPGSEAVRGSRGHRQYHGRQLAGTGAGHDQLQRVRRRTPWKPPSGRSPAPETFAARCCSPPTWPTTRIRSRR